MPHLVGRRIEEAVKQVHAVDLDAMTDGLRVGDDVSGTEQKQAKNCGT